MLQPDFGTEINRKYMAFVEFRNIQYALSVHQKTLGSPQRQGQSHIEAYSWPFGLQKKQDLDEEDSETDFKAIDFDEVNFGDSSSNESDFDGVGLDQIFLDGFYNIENNNESESAPRVEMDLDADFGLMGEIDFATASLLTKAIEALERKALKSMTLERKVL
ncbi:hypothetical protein BGZ80_002583, partial [Entomortierella chlamydospora]